MLTSPELPALNPASPSVLVTPVALASFSPRGCLALSHLRALSLLFLPRGRPFPQPCAHLDPCHPQISIWSHLLEAVPIISCIALTTCLGLFVHTLVYSLRSSCRKYRALPHLCLSWLHLRSLTQELTHSRTQEIQWQKERREGGRRQRDSLVGGGREARVPLCPIMWDPQREGEETAFKSS